MKHCYKYMIVCALLGLGLMFVSTRLGLPAYLAPFLVPVMMIGCCVLPMLLIILTSNTKGSAKGCCSGDKKSKLVPVASSVAEEKVRHCH